MDAKTRPDQLREATNPLFNHRKLKLGTFCSNLSGGCAISSIEGVLEATWPDTLALARMGDQMEFEALVPVGRWRGFGGVTNFNGQGFESFSWASAIGASTRYPGIFATSHVPTIHPVMAAKQAATIDHVTGGRFNLNVVTGWYKPEIEMFGEEQLEHDTRYDRAIEWLEIIKLLWTSEEEFDYEGKFYKIKKGWLQPKPIQKPYPVVMNAGGSDKGRHYAAKYCDVAFIVLQSHKFEDVKARRQFDHDAGHQCPDHAARCGAPPEGAFHCRLGRLSDRRHQGEGGRRAGDARSRRLRRRHSLVGEVRRADARIPGGHVSAGGAGGAALGRVACARKGSPVARAVVDPRMDRFDLSSGRGSR
jgi:alkanesulfonate monooxygenase SsuD/methylene tetrahydromethanopterin reductase-like flavin-dependent oxidoreductase (luciferase family)